VHSLQDEIAALLSEESHANKAHFAFDLPVWEKTVAPLNSQLIDLTTVVSHIVPFSA